MDSYEDEEVFGELEFDVNPSFIKSKEWNSIKDIINDELASLRKQNESIRTDMNTTFFVRGGISKLEWLINRVEAKGFFDPEGID